MVLPPWPRGPLPRVLIIVATFVTGPAKTGHICTNYTCSEKSTFLGPYV